MRPPLPSILSLTLLALCACLPAHAQSTAAEVTDAQLGVFKRGMELGCRDAGKQQRQSDAQAEAFCGCVMKILNDNVTPADWRTAYLEDGRGNPAEVQRLIFGPNAEKFRACRAPQ